MQTSQLCKRIIPCLDVKDGMTVKGVKFTELRKIGDPVELAKEYELQGADEIVFLDISATVEGRATTIDLVSRVANELSIPFTVGGGISTIEQVTKLLAHGADKISINSAAFRNPQLITEIAEKFGSQCCVVAIDVRAHGPQSHEPVKGLHWSAAPTGSADVRAHGAQRWEVLLDGGRTATGADAFEWAQKCVELGAGEILLTSWDRDGTNEGFDLELVRTFAEALPIPIIASGGAKDPESFTAVFTSGKADAALAASIFHDNKFSIQEVKTKLQEAGVTVRPC